LLIEPLNQACKGAFNGFLDFKGLCNYVVMTGKKQGFKGKDKISQILTSCVDMIFVTLAALMPYMRRNPKFSQLLEFQFTLDEDLRAYLYKIKERINLDLRDSKLHNEWKLKLVDCVFRKA